MSKLTNIVAGVAITGVVLTSGCSKGYFSDVLRGALKSQEVPITLVGTECEPIITKRAYQTLQECGDMPQEKKGKALYKNKIEHALCSLQDINDPNAFQLSVDYYNDYPESGMRILERAYEKQEGFKNSK